VFVSGGDFRIVNNLPSQPDELMRARMVSIKENAEHLILILLQEKTLYLQYVQISVTIVLFGRQTVQAGRLGGH